MIRGGGHLRVVSPRAGVGCGRHSEGRGWGEGGREINQRPVPDLRRVVSTKVQDLTAPRAIGSTAMAWPNKRSWSHRRLQREDVTFLRGHIAHTQK